MVIWWDFNQQQWWFDGTLTMNEGDLMGFIGGAGRLRTTGQTTIF
jgi:hypothetical protein